jgi:hypothetical protein
MQDPVECIEQFFFQVHIRAHRPLSRAPMPWCPEQNPTIHDRCR